MNNLQEKNLKKHLYKKALLLPLKPGCYLMKDENHNILYVGKAKELKKRVLSYFDDSAKNIKTQVLVQKVSDFEFILSGSEVEALILENNLIKKYRPKYNISLRDDKTYPYVMVDKKELFPLLRYVRKFEPEKSRLYYGPFVAGSNISQVLRVLRRAFSLRDCSNHVFNKRKNPCLLFQMDYCSAPCVQKISTDDYQKSLEMALNFFQGKGEYSLNYLRERMHSFAESHQFEKAAIVRDQVFILEKFCDVYNMKDLSKKESMGDLDILSYYKGDAEVDISINMIRKGILLGTKNFHFKIDDCIEAIEEELFKKVVEYYLELNFNYPQIVVSPFSKKLNSFLKEIIQKRVEDISIEVISPEKKFETLTRLAADHAFESQRVRQSKSSVNEAALMKLKELLGMNQLPVKIECYDIAIWQGRSPTASQVVFRNGVPEKSLYRHYHLSVRVEGNNDFAMLKEVIGRRIKKGDLPDLFVVDGGKGQLSAFEQVLKDENICIPVVAIAKAKSKNKSEERLFIPKRSNPYLLTKNRALFQLLTQMRDESHRFSRRLHHKRESKRLFSTWLDNIKGIGPQTKKKILQHLDKEPHELLYLSKEELAGYLKITLNQAEAILEALQHRKNSVDDM
jgi:excinuclease ABC subunit C